MKKKTFLSKFCLLFVFGFSGLFFTATACGDKDADDGGTGTETPVTSQSYTVGGVSFTMKKVAGGTFAMGAQSVDASQPNYDTDAYEWEAPVHNVTLSDFWIGETEVTQALWEAVMGTNPSYYSGKPNNPVEWVNWNDVQTFIAALNAATGKTFRLPSESEWEYAARGGKQSAGTKYSGSNTVSDVAWYWDNIPTQNDSEAGYGTQPVKGKQANELGLYDMSGNVWEWCQDSWDYSANYGSTPTDGSANTIGYDRVFRGGSFVNDVRRTHVSYRSGFTPGLSHGNVGFRLACSSN